MNFWSGKQDCSHRILVVDDVADNSYLMQALLESEGYQVEIADSGYAAIAKIKSAPPDLVLLDVMMPGMNGYEVVQRIRQNPNLSLLPIFLVTGHEQLECWDAVDGKVSGLIRKPINFEEVLTRVRSALQQQSFV
jgi:CheY-like chemotaxis protein